MARNIQNCPWETYKQFLHTHLSARMILVNFYPTKILTSNGSKPIGVLTQKKSSCSEDSLPIGYYILDFELI